MIADLVEIACIVDRSGSMASIRVEAIGGLNAFIESQKHEPGSARLTLVLFDNEYLLLHHSVPIQDVPPITAETFVPRGTTALLDAIGRTIDDVGASLAKLPEDERPGKVIICILTDGIENASQRFTRPMIAEKIKHQSEKYNWQFVFLAANQDAISAGVQLNIAARDSRNFASTPTGTKEGFDAMCNLVRAKRSQ